MFNLSNETLKFLIFLSIAIVFLFIDFLSRFLLHLLCEYKYLICKRDCKKCGNWCCKLFDVYNTYNNNSVQTENDNNKNI